MASRPKIAREIQPHDPRLDYLGWLTPTQLGDVKAVVLRGETATKRAEERGVTKATVLVNLENARERLNEVYRQEENIVGDEV